MDSKGGERYDRGESIAGSMDGETRGDCILLVEGIVNFDSFAFAIAPANHDHSLGTNRVRNSGRVILIFAIWSAGGGIIIGIEQPVVIIPVDHAFGGLL